MKIIIILFVAYLAIILWYTVFMRYPVFKAPQLELFWSYKKWLAGSGMLGREIVGNICLFVPFGFLLTAFLPEHKKTSLMVLIAGFMFSCIIECFQFNLMRGMLEYDDIFNNSLGAIVGYILYKIVNKTSRKQNRKVPVITLGIIFVAIGVLVCICDNITNGVEEINTPRSFCFQVDKAAFDGDKLVLKGFAFSYEREISEFNLMLKSTNTGKQINAVSQYRLQRPDVNNYFKCAIDYSESGFIATMPIINIDEEYEVIVNLGRFISFSTGVYITGTDIHYVQQSHFIPLNVEGTDLEEIVKKGYLRVYRPDCSCFVYQYKGCLYWIADTTFDFENDGTTYIQYQLWTTQPENLPQKRLKNKWYWDNIGGYFEKHEITDSINCGRYRVCKRKLPKEYSISSVVTGYYKNGQWIWRNYFRPVYEF